MADTQNSAGDESERDEAQRDDSQRDRPQRDEPIVRDKRRVDPKTGKVRRPKRSDAASEADASAPDGPVGDQEAPLGADAAEVPEGSGDSDGGFEGPDVETSLSDSDLDFLSGQSDAEQLAGERLADLQRVTAEYANYRRRTETNREVERERSVGETVKMLLPVLDDLDRAEKHGDLVDDTAFGTIGAKLRAAVKRLGATPFGDVGEPFDPALHEAIFQQPSAEATSDTIADVVETGYLLGSTLLRAAKVVVATPEA